MRRLGWILVALAVLPGCKLLKGKSKDNIEPPAALVDFEKSASVKQIWSVGTGEGVERTGARPRPAYADDRIFITDVEGGLIAFTAANGKRVWRYESAERLVSGADARDGLVVAGSIDGLVVAVDADSGAERWTSRVSSELLVAPVIAGSIIVVRSNDGRVHGLSAADGTRVWQFDRGSPLISLRGNGPTLISAGKAFIGYDNARVVALSVADGALLWEQTIARTDGRTELDRMNDVDGELQLSDDAVYSVTFRGQVTALALDTGRPLWARDLSSYGGLSGAGDALYAVDDQGVLWSLDRRSGSSLWKQDALSHRWMTTPVVIGDFIVMGDVEGYVHWLRREDGATVARFRLGKKGVRATPLVVGNRVFVASVDGKLAAYELKI
ncbi:MAG: outer membrane protein assembly factor BamB [Pseudomonadota bacterium]|nr:outer membrane protein assembly factor BamB [Pseudomonadota bacterium]